MVEKYARVVDREADDINVKQVDGSSDEGE
jgi:hypothetical protein